MRNSFANRRVLIPLLAVAGLMVVGACSSDYDRVSPGSTYVQGGPANREANRPSGERGDLTREDQNAGVNVNRFAWRAALDTVSFMPIRTSDPFGGLIATDWYSPRETPGERLRLNVRIRGTQLAADTVKVTVFREVRSGEGAWETAEVSERTARDLENVILTRARALRIEAQAAE